MFFTQQNIAVTVMIDDIREGIPQDNIDAITVNLTDAILPLPPLKYNGHYGIATMTLGFSLTNTSDDFTMTPVQTSKCTALLQISHIQNGWNCFLRDKNFNNYYIFIEISNFTKFCTTNKILCTKLRKEKIINKGMFRRMQKKLQ